MRTTLGILVALMLGGAAAPALAHHSFATEYDGSKIISLQGVVTKVEWTNPHARVYMDVTDASGKVTNWNLELASPSALNRNGWGSRTLKIGDKISIKGFGSRSDSTRVNPKSVLSADGRALFTGPGDDGYDANAARQ